jgi:hypothetical protein
LGDIDVKTLADAARYTNLRRWYWRFYLGGVAWFAVLGTPLFAFGSRLNPLVESMLAVPLVLGFLTCCVGSLVAWSALTRFRCPRCGERFIISSSSSWPTPNCKHCGLRLE